MYVHARSKQVNALSVQVLNWVPQNDLLAHPQIRAFVSHAGINSVYEVRQVTRLEKRTTESQKRVTIFEHGLLKMFEDLPHSVARQ